MHLIQYCQLLIPMIDIEVFALPHIVKYKQGSAHLEAASTALLTKASWLHCVRKAETAAAAKRRAAIVISLSNNQQGGDDLTAGNINKAFLVLYSH